MPVVALAGFPSHSSPFLPLGGCRIPPQARQHVLRPVHDPGSGEPPGRPGSGFPEPGSRKLLPRFRGRISALQVPSTRTKEHRAIATFKIGDVVILKSSSPTMTVTKTVGTTVDRHWFHGEGACHDAFPEVALVKFEAPKPLRYLFE